MASGLACRAGEPAFKPSVQLRAPVSHRASELAVAGAIARDAKAFKGRFAKAAVCRRLRCGEYVHWSLPSFVGKARFSYSLRRHRWGNSLALDVPIALLLDPSGPSFF
jgi:hypothetical protein